MGRLLFLAGGYSCSWMVTNDPGVTLPPHRGRVSGTQGQRWWVLLLLGTAGPPTPALVRLVIFTAEHVYSGNPGDRFSAQGVISHNKLVFYNWYKAVWVYMKHGVHIKQYSLAKRADKIGYYLVFMTYVGCFSPKSMVSTWIVSYLLVYTWHTPIHYPHAANAGCVLAGVAPVSLILANRIIFCIFCSYHKTEINTGFYWNGVQNDIYYVKNSILYGFLKIHIHTHAIHDGVSILCLLNKMGWL